MTSRGPAALLIAALLGVLCAAPAAAVGVERLSRVSPSSGRTSSLEVASGLLSVKFSEGADIQAASAALRGLGYSLSDRRSYGGWRMVLLPAGVGVSAALSSVRGLPFVAAAEPDKIYRPRRVPDDPYLPFQYALGKVQAYGAWEYETGASSRVTVAVIDTGVEKYHPEFLGKFDDSISQFCNPGANKNSGADNSVCVPQNPPTQACYHGTSVAGVAAALGNNAAGVSGMSWGARLVSIKIFRDADCPDDCYDNACGTDDWAMADALTFLASVSGTPAYGKIVANMSIGCRAFDCGTCSSMLQYAVNTATTAGVMIFAAAGNGLNGVGDDLIDSPANCQGVIAVGATDQSDSLAPFSSTDSDMVSKGLTAPGVEIYTTTISSSYASVSGTSFSSPMAAGLAALVWSAKLTGDPAYSAAQVFDVMKNSADDLGPAGPDRNFGWGRINAMKALRLAATGTTRFAGTNKAVAYPNPFRPATQRLVTFTVPQEMSASGLEVKVYTSEGELVRKLESSSWDGKNEAGAPVASGVYIFRVKTDKDSAVGKMALIR